MAAFGAFTFGVEEEPVLDTGWLMPKGAASMDASLPLGAAQESIVVIGGGHGFGGVGSRRRTIELYMTPARFALLEALLNTDDGFVDWDSTPVTYAARMVGCECIDYLAAYGTSSAMRLVRLQLVQVLI